MKKLLLLSVAALLLIPAGICNAKAKNGIENVSFSEVGMIVVDTDGHNRANFVADLSWLLDRGHIPSTTGNMSLILSPNERILFHDGKISDYFCVEDSGSRCRAKITGTVMLQSFGGRSQSRDGKDLEYSAKVFGMNDETRELEPNAIRSIDNIPLKISYNMGQFEMVKNR